ncbi:hypothetical protein cypCar_00019556 [Cyprinus carpio]|nr:hypothetical protein cypCar_00019556 [Cyprinus carpio]
MKQTKPQKDREGLYLEVTAVNGAVSLPLLSSIVLFLLSYTECSSFHVYLVTDQGSILSGLMPGGLAVSEVRRDELPGLVRMWRLPAALESAACICRAGLAVVLRHIIQRACQLMPSRRDVASLLCFKNTCLKACAENHVISVDVHLVLCFCSLFNQISPQNLCFGHEVCSVNGKTGLLNQHRKVAEITTPKDQYITGHDGTVVIQRTAGGCEPNLAISGKMSDARVVHKRQQLNNLVAMVTELACPGHTVVDFCSGGGHVGIVLAYTLPKCQVILFENKEESLVRA